MDADIRFEWDAKKDIANRVKHGVSFEEAKTVFFDPMMVLYDDIDHSLAEDRFIAVGFSYKERTLIVCHCYRRENEVIRIISARKANSKEIEDFNNFR